MIFVELPGIVFKLLNSYVLLHNNIVMCFCLQPSELYDIQNFVKKFSRFLIGKAGGRHIAGLNSTFSRRYMLVSIICRTHKISPLNKRELRRFATRIWSCCDPQLGNITRVCK